MQLGRRLDWREQLIAEVERHPIGYVEIIDPACEECRYWGNAPAGLRAINIWIGEEADLGKRYGTKMLQLALARCFADLMVLAVLLDPLAENARAHRFHARLGFRFVERCRFGRDDCFVYSLDRANFAKLSADALRQ